MNLLVGFKAADLTPELLAGETVVHVLDIYHRHAIEKVHHAKVVCSPHLPEGPWDVIRLRTGPKLMSGELSLDLLQEAARLAGGDLRAPRFILDFVGRERDRNDLLDKVRERADRVFRSEWTASVPGGEKMLFTSYPGCFCHRRLDEGGLALAEVVSRDLLEKVERVEKTALLDMGCGCGLVGFLIANRMSCERQLKHSNEVFAKPCPSGEAGTPPLRRCGVSPHHDGGSESSSNNSNTQSISLVMVDSHSRAIEAANENSAKFGIPAEVILSDNGTPARMDGTFDVFVGNPPYYSDYRIADVFLETAKRALKPGGVCYTVCKNAAGLQPVQEKYFPSVAVVKRRGYCVLRSVKG